MLVEDALLCQDPKRLPVLVRDYAHQRSPARVPPFPCWVMGWWRVDLPTHQSSAGPECLTSLGRREEDRQAGGRQAVNSQRWLSVAAVWGRRAGEVGLGPGCPGKELAFDSKSDRATEGLESELCP